METSSVVMFLIIGLLAGWLSSKLVKGRGLGLIADLVVGVIGSYIGGWLFTQLGIKTTGGFIGSLVTAVVGAIVFLFFVNLIKKV